MSRQENQLKNTEQPLIEDLSVDQDQAAEVKGGPIYIKVDGVNGDLADNSAIHKVIET